jgi:RNA polymerase sigma-70 factor, ECF subfamily
MTTASATELNPSLLATFDALVRDRRPSLLRLAARRSGTTDLETAEDIVQEAVFCAWSRLHRFSGRSALSTWVHGFVVNVARKLRERVGRARTSEDGGDLDDVCGADPDSLDCAVRREQRAEIGRTLRRLAPSDRRALVLRHLRDCDTDDLAARLGVSGGTLRVRLHRASARFAALARLEFAA